MLLKVDLKTKHATRVRGSKLKDFGLDERSFQDILFRSLDRLIPDDELLILMQSRRGPEEPDLMALDKDGKLYIFELKAWEARSENLLQVYAMGNSLVLTSTIIQKSYINYIIKAKKHYQDN